MFQTVLRFFEIREQNRYDVQKIYVKCNYIHPSSYASKSNSRGIFNFRTPQTVQYINFVSKKKYVN